MLLSENLRQRSMSSILKSHEFHEWNRLTYARSPVDIIGTIRGSRSDLLKPVERWTQRRKIDLCRGLCAEIVTTSEVILAHGLAYHEIDRWMDAYRREDFESLKVGYLRKGRAGRALCRSPGRSSRAQR
jgi:uncharacterized protein DUF1153